MRSCQQNKLAVDTKKNWNKYHAQWMYRDEIPANPRTIKAILSRLDVKNKKILEVGSGTGRDSIYLAKLGAECVLLDYFFTPKRKGLVDLII